jgi:hypothetical protein
MKTKRNVEEFGREREKIEDEKRQLTNIERELQRGNFLKEGKSSFWGDYDRQFDSLKTMILKK